MQQSKFIKLLNRFHQNKANEKEAALIDAWYKSYQAREDNIQIDEKQKELVKNSLKKQINARQKFALRNLNNPLYKLAAAVIFFCAISLLFVSKRNKHQKRLNSYALSTTEAGQIKKIVLPDSSIVWLNAASRLRVKGGFIGDIREVYLDEGEAFFEVKKNADKAFIVHSQGINVKVLGTSFNVRSYKALPFVKVNVTTGKVGIAKGDKHVAFLMPEEQLLYNKLTDVSTQTINKSLEAGNWREGKIYLHQASFKELQMILKNSYKVFIRPGSKEVNNYHFTLTISTDMSKEEIYKIISAIHDSKYRKEGNEMILY